MILKGSVRGKGGDLATHLMNVVENDHVEVLQIRGFASDDLAGAFKESFAISRGTKCSKYLFSLSLSPPKDAVLSDKEFEEAADRAEKALGLDDLSRVIVVHEKEGRRHAHAVWSRIDATTMTARPLPFFKNKLSELSKEFYLANGWKMPAGFLDKSEKAVEFSMAEYLRSKQRGYDLRDVYPMVLSRW